MAVTDQRPTTNGERGGGWRTYMDGVWVGGRGLPDMTTTINPQLPAMPFRRQQPPFFSCSLPREDGKIFIECKKRMRIQIAKENFGGFIFFRFVGLKAVICFSTLSVDPVRFHGGFQFQRARNESHKSLFTYLA